ncbi:unnamed protein product [Caenorhabditis auriculariae]|uniref:Uncharacterized protein n=1 Tax=Caenorhabditis auriculariae TaxID=2777116 RepID=A0A8S1HUK1_9PELO|nr:unnamed protein product [Caenorhabditis auriculariae]
MPRSRDFIDAHWFYSSDEDSERSTESADGNFEPPHEPESTEDYRGPSNSISCFQMSTSCSSFIRSIVSLKMVQNHFYQFEETPQKFLEKIARSPTFETLNLRYLYTSEIPMQKAVNVWFVIDSGAPYTYLSVKSLEVIVGEGFTHSLHNITIQDEAKAVPCHTSRHHFAEANLLGMDSLRKLGLGIVPDWEKDTFQLIKI